MVDLQEIQEAHLKSTSQPHLNFDIFDLALSMMGQDWRNRRCRRGPSRQTILVLTNVYFELVIISMQLYDSILLQIWDVITWNDENHEFYYYAYKYNEPDGEKYYTEYSTGTYSTGTYSTPCKTAVLLTQRRYVWQLSWLCELDDIIFDIQKKKTVSSLIIMT